MKKRLLSMLLISAICTTMTIGASEGVISIIEPINDLIDVSTIIDQTTDTEPLNNEEATETDESTESIEQDEISEQTDIASIYQSPQSVLINEITQSVIEQTQNPTPQGDVYTIKFEKIEQLVHDNSITVMANEETLDSIETMSYAEVDILLKMARSQLESAVSTLNSTSAALDEAISPLDSIIISSAVDEEGNPVVSDTDKELAIAMKSYLEAQQTTISVDIITLKSEISDINSQIDTIDETIDEIDTVYETTRVQFESIEKQLAIGAETIYLALTSIDLQQQELQRSLASLDRTIEEMEKRYELGQISELQLLQVKNQRSGLSSTMETLKVQVKGLKTDLAIMLGYEATAVIQISDLPTINQTINYDTDLALAIENSYTLYTLKDNIRQASNDYEKFYTYTVHAFESAKYAYDAGEQQLIGSFSKLYNDLGEKARLVEQEQSNLEYETRVFEAVQLKYELGMISKNTYLSAEDTYKSAQAAVTKAQNELFASQNTYEWAKKGVI